MSGYAYDTSTLTLVAKLDDGTEVHIVGVNDGVNGYEWTAIQVFPGNPHASIPIGLTVHDEVLVDGIDAGDDDDPGEALRQRATCSNCLARAYRGEECVCEDGGDAEDYDELRATTPEKGD